MEPFYDNQIDPDLVQQAVYYVDMLLHDARHKSTGNFTTPLEEILDKIYELDLPSNVLAELYLKARRKYFGPRFNEI